MAIDAPCPPHPFDPAPMKVLVADDDPVYRHLLDSTLASWGFQVTVASDGTDALRLVDSDSPPDLVILDWVMPGMSGDELCRHIRQQPRDRYIYILLLSARRSHEDLVKGLEAGADDFLAKPFDPAELKARLNTGRRILHLQNELIAAREAMRRQATRDSLTGAWNHAAILEVLDRELGRARREGRPLGIVLADLDHFKQINDSLGHQAGDAVLRDVVTRISNVVRPDDLVGRYGGEEFLLVLPGCDVASTQKVCERIRQHIADQPIAYESHTIPITISLGATVFHAPYLADAVSLVRIADMELYRAKAAGRNRVEIAPVG